MMRSSTALKFRFILFAGLIVGTLDISGALLVFAAERHRAPWIVLKFIASGFFGARALHGGTGMMLMGLIFHYFIALSFTGLFYLAYVRYRILPRNPLLCGVVYASFMWLIMDVIVVPLSCAPAGLPTPERSVKAIFILMLTIGLPLPLLWKIVAGRKTNDLAKSSLRKR